MKQLIINNFKFNALTEDDLVSIEPSDAKRLMNQNNDNYRKISNQEVIKYSKSIHNDVWAFNGDTIGITSDGKLKDGQHRMLACINTGKPLKIFPVLIEDDVTIDNKKKLEFEDILYSCGYKNSRNLAASIKLLYRYSNKYQNYISTAQSIDNTTIFEFFINNKDILTAFNKTEKYSKKIKLPHSVYAFISCITYRMDASLSDYFIKYLTLNLTDYDEMNIQPMDAMYQLKKLLMTETVENKIPLVMKVALIIKTWNCWRKNEYCPKLNWICTGPHPEKFPDFY